ncbi:MAG: DUF3047 domain-containing protein [Magnetovibrio sp.]|nr:DUF3047 domain-containing protein [Magnetovibrio sp.]
MKLIRLAVVAGLLAAPLGASAAAGPTWKMLEVPGIEPTQFRVDADVIAIDSRMGASFLYRDLTPAERRATVLRWRWRVDMDMPAADLRRPGADDRELAVHVWFPETAAAGDLFERLRNTVVSVLGFPVTGRTLSYVWGGRGARGEGFPNPHNAPDGHMIILRPGGTPTGRWMDETIDIAADYRRVFGTEPPPAGYVAVSSDSDDLGGVCVGRIAGLRFGA